MKLTLWEQTYKSNRNSITGTFFNRSHFWWYINKAKAHNTRKHTPTNAINIVLIIWFWVYSQHSSSPIFISSYFCLFILISFFIGILYPNYFCCCCCCCYLLNAKHNFVANCRKWSNKIHANLLQWKWSENKNTISYFMCARLCILIV